MRHPLQALSWEIWRRSRGSIWLVAGIISFCWVLNVLVPDSSIHSASNRERLLNVKWMLAVISFLFVFGIFNYTEFDPRKEWTGFPYRLFVLPVPTWLLVVCPIFLGVATVECVYLAWAKLLFTYAGGSRLVWFAVLLATYMVFYQTILWSLAGFRILRLIVLGLTGAALIGVAFLPFFARYIQSPWFSKTLLSALLAGMALNALITAWISVERQRRGGGRRRSLLLSACTERILDRLPNRSRTLASPSEAQFWFEWRRTGLLLPICVGALLLFVIAPLSWFDRKNPGDTLWILAWTLAMPLLLAAALGKGFSKPDFWTTELAVPSFLAVRPLASGDLVVIKMKVAAVSAALSWLLVLMFLSFWLPFWANLDSLNMVRLGYWMVYDHALAPQYLIAVLFIAAMMLLTWRCMVGSLWVGLSGSRELVIRSAVVHGLVGVAVVLGFALLLAHDELVRQTVRKNPDFGLSWFEWVLACAVMAKFWMATFSWRRIASARVRKYMLIWSGGTFVLIALALLIWARGTLVLLLIQLGFLPMDVYRVKYLLILIALLTIPVARLGLAPLSLARNRHR